MQCTINLTLQYMVIFTALGICRSWLDFQAASYESSAVQKALKHASETVFYAPMACLMFVGFRMRVLQLTKGQGNPQEFVQLAMQGVAYSILANTVMVLIIPVFLNCDTNDVELDKNTGELKTDGKNPFENAILAMTFTAIRYACFLALYVGFGAVVYGLFTFEPPAGVWDGPIPDVSPAVFCTCLLACAFFSIYCLLAISRTYSQFTKGGRSTSKFEEVMLGGADTLALAPMLCTLFLAARMRALQMDPVGGNPQRWAQRCFYAASYCLIAQTVMAAIVPLCLKAKALPKDDKTVEGDVKYEFEGDQGQGLLPKILTALRFIIMVSVYACTTAVVCSVFTIQHPEGKELTPPLSPTMQCVLNLVFQYFLIYVLLWIFITVEDLSSGQINLHAAKDAIESAKSTVQFAPMLCILFVATCMRALQMTDNKGAPQGWVQDGMYLATWSIMMQFMMCLIMPFFLGHKYTPDTLDGAQKPASNDNVSNTFGAWAVTIVRYSALIALLGGVTTVTIGVFMMTPETANGRGAIPLIADGTLPVDLAPEPVGINDVLGAKGAMKSVGETVGSGVDAVDGAGATVTETVTGF